MKEIDRHAQSFERFFRYWYDDRLCFAKPNSFLETVVTESGTGDTAQLSGDRMLVVQLPCNTSGGYMWECKGPVSSLLKDVSGMNDADTSAEFFNISHQNDKSHIGDKEFQVLRFTGSDTGWCELELVEHRPWEKNKPPIAMFSLSVHVGGIFTGTYSRPLPMESRPFISHTIAASTVGLPARFNWVDSNIVTPIKDQGSTGCCWAFAACGVFESQIMRFGGRSSGNWVDCSEQYLVSCNPWGMSSASGGMFPFPMAIDYVATDCGQTEAGVVYESDLPFNESDPDAITVSSPLPHHEKLAVWGYVGDLVDDPNPSLDHYSTTDQIKQAIWKYGPIAVCVNDNNWTKYKGGVMSYSTSDVNHIIDITGWNDDSSCYYVKNSWGTVWGEKGFARVAYETSSIGTYQCWASYNDTNNVVATLSGKTAAESLPIVRNGRLSWSMISAGHVCIEVYSIDGKKIQSVTDAFFSAGAHTMSLPMKNLSKSIKILKLSIDGKNCRTVKDITIN